MRYQPLFSLQIWHAGYGDGRFGDLQLHLRAEDQRELARHRALVRARPHGLEVAVRMASDDTPMVAIAGLTASFELRATSPNFAANTDLSAWAELDGMARYALVDDDEKLQLVGAVPRSADPGVLARIDVPSVSAAWLASPPTFTLAFAPRQAVWVYYLLTKRADDGQPRIEDGDRKHPLSFVRKRLTAANTPASDDPIGARLLQRNPGHRCHRLTSKRPVAWRRTARRQLSLYLGDELLIRELATPALQNSSILAKPTRETLYRVVVY